MMACPDRHRASASHQNARLAGVLALVMLMLVVSGCASTPQLAESTRQHLPRQALLEEVPFHGQRDYQCGPASLAMVLNAAGVPVTVDTLIPQVFLPGREGSVQPEMLGTVRRQGRIPFRIDGSLDALLTEINAGHPVVVMQNLSLPAWPVWHYAVAIGFDRGEKTLTLHSGMEPERLESFKRFDATWARSERWAFIALPPGQLPATGDGRAALDAIADFERVQGYRPRCPPGRHWWSTTQTWPWAISPWAVPAMRPATPMAPARPSRTPWRRIPSWPWPGSTWDCCTAARVAPTRREPPSSGPPTSPAPGRHRRRRPSRTCRGGPADAELIERN